jgi:alkanesulfonate monooxygenase SsuD/methylene tetrahydromethanopterin reductase-like flavin-dependent oxidoreductase (luciferase family)
MRFGLHFLLSCSDSQTPRQRYRDTIEQAVHAEALGFESVWPVEQHFNRQVSVMPCPSLLLAAIAERTERLRLGTGIVQLALAHPLRVAEELATLDNLSNGRVEFGVGRGSNPAHFAGFGVVAAESRERMAEGLAYIRAAWTSDRFSFAGRYFQADDLSLAPLPVQRPHPPIRVAVNNVETAVWAGQHAYPILLATQVNPIPRLKQLIDGYREARRDSGRSEPKPDDISVVMPMFVGDDHAQVKAELEPSIRHFASLTASLAAAALPRASEAERVVLLPILERLRSLDYARLQDSLGVVGSPAQCITRLEQIQRELNPGRIIGWFNFGGLVPHEQVMRSMERFAREVMPAF